MAALIPVYIVLLEWLFKPLKSGGLRAWPPFFIGLGVFYAILFLVDSPKILAAVFGCVFAAFGIGTSSKLFVGVPFVVPFLSGAGTIGAYLATAFVVGAIALGLVFQPPLRAQADAVLILRLVEVISLVEDNPTKWNELPFRVQLIAKIEIIAAHIQATLSRALRSRDPEISRWSKEYTNAVATSIRSLANWLIAPRTDTRDGFLKRLCEVLVCVAKGNWDGIPRDAQSPTPMREGWFPRVIRLGKLTITSIIPLAILWLLVQERWRNGNRGGRNRILRQRRWFFSCANIRTRWRGWTRSRRGSWPFTVRGGGRVAHPIHQFAPIQ